MPDKKLNGIERISEVLNDYSVIIVFVIFGAIANAMMELKIARDEGEKFNWIDFSVSFFIAIFSGMVFTLSAGGLGATGMSLGLAGSIGAFLGVKGLNKVADNVLDKVAGKKGG